MKKKILITLLLAVLLCVLWGCESNQECAHQWTQADCTTPQTCASCGETQGEAMGHTWQAATCRASKTCQVCGLKEGEALPHDYELAGFHGDTMQYRCRVCSATSDQPIDRELYLQTRLTELAGHWDLFAIKKGNQQTSANDITAVGPYLNVMEDGTLRLFLEDGQVQDLTYQFVEYQEVDGSGVYSCEFVNSADQAQYPAVFTDMKNEAEIAITLPDNSTIILQRNKLIEDYVTGKWHSFYDCDQLYTMEMKADRTFTADVDGGISGTWHIKPMFVENYGIDCDAFTLTLSFTLDGTPTVRNLPVVLAPAGEGIQALNGDPRYSVSFNLRDENQTNMYSPSSFPGEHTVIAEDAAKILGDWVTSEVTTLSYELHTGITEQTSEYTAVFNEDGTFEISTSKPMNGSWYYICTSNDNGSICYRFALKITGGVGYTPLTLVTLGSKPEWLFYEYTGGYDSIEYKFQPAK